MALIAIGSDRNLLIDVIETINDNGALTPARGVNEQAAYMKTQMSC